MGMIGSFLGFRGRGGLIDKELQNQLGGTQSLALLGQQQRQNAAMAQALSHSASGVQAPGAALRQGAQFLQGANAQSQQQAQQARLREKQQAIQAMDAFQSQRRMDNRQAFGRVLGAGASLGSFFSDKRAKRDVRDTSPDKMREFLRASKAKDWAYRDEFGGQRRTGPMAQDLERSTIGKRLVSRDAATGMRKVDAGGAISALLAAAGSLNDRLERVESKGGGNA